MKFAEWVSNVVQLFKPVNKVTKVNSLGYVVTVQSIRPKHEVELVANYLSNACEGIPVELDTTKIDFDE